MAMCVLWLLTTYDRPTGPSSVLHRDSNEPVAQVCRDRTVLLWPAERDGRSKGPSSGNSIGLSTTIVALPTRAVEATADGPEAEPIPSFGYADLVKELTRARGKPRMRWLVPYQRLRSQAPVGPCNNFRSVAGVKARRQWGSEKPTMRYNRTAKLAVRMKVLDQQQPAFFAAAERQLEALLFGRVTPGTLHLPWTRRAPSSRTPFAASLGSAGVPPGEVSIPSFSIS